MLNIDEYLLSFCKGRDHSPKTLIGSVSLKRHLPSFLKSFETKFWQNVFAKSQKFILNRIICRLLQSFL